MDSRPRVRVQGAEREDRSPRRLDVSHFPYANRDLLKLDLVDRLSGFAY